MSEPEGPTDDGLAPEGTSDGDGSVTVVGTAHVSSESADRVRETIEEHRPDVVAVELDEARYRQLEGETPDDLEATDLLAGNTVFQFLAYWMLSYVQNRLGDRFDVEPGADMKAAIAAAEAGGHGLALVDRDIQTTIQRFWARMSTREKLTLVGGLALGAANPLTIGVAFGISLGLLVGLIGGLAVAPALGLEGIFTLGLAGTTAATVFGGAVLGALFGLFVGVALFPTVQLPGVGRTGIATRAVGGIVVGGVAGVYLAATGTALPLVGTPGFAGIGESVLRGGVGATLGGLLGGLLGLGLGAVLSTATADPDEFDGLDIEELTEADVVTAMIEEFRRFSPGGAEALIDERDAYIAHKLVALRDGGYNVVAVVGAGHREGIERYLDAPQTLPPVESITGIESGSRFSLFRLFGYAVMIGFLAFFGLLAMAGAQNTFLLQLFGAWFLFNGVFAFTAARLAGAKLPSAGVGGAVAWLTSINPLLAPGWFAGYVELRYRPVNVGDIGTLNELLEDHERPLSEVLGDMLDVPLFRLIAVVAMTNIGSLVATLLFPFVVLPFFFEGVAGVSEIGDMMLEGARNSAELIAEVVT